MMITTFEHSTEAYRIKQQNKAAMACIFAWRFAVFDFSYLNYKRQVRRVSFLNKDSSLLLELFLIILRNYLLQSLGEGTLQKK